jgi:hypothetical protein
MSLEFLAKCNKWLYVSTASDNLYDYIEANRISALFGILGRTLGRGSWIDCESISSRNETRKASTKAGVEVYINTAGFKIAADVTVDRRVECLLLVRTSWFGARWLSFVHEALASWIVASGPVSTA